MRVDLSTKNEKFFAGILLAVVLVVLYFLLPPLITIMKNLWIAAILGLPAVYLIWNWEFVWDSFKLFVENTNKKFISADPIGYMYRYYYYIVAKLKDLLANTESVIAVHKELDREVTKLKQSVKSNLNLALTYEKQGASKNTMDALNAKIAADQQQLESLEPQLLNLGSQVVALTELHDLWANDAETYKYTLDGKAREYELMKKISQATNSAKSFLGEDSPQLRTHKESLKQIEQNVAQYAANVESFERRAKPIIEKLSLQQTAASDIGAQLVADFKNSISGVTLEDVKPAPTTPAK